MTRRTKIIATLGPASDDPKTLTQMIAAGMDVARINFSHGTHDDQKNHIKKLRNAAKSCNKQVGLLADLQGPKIRIARFKQNSVHLTTGHTFVLDSNHPSDEGDEHCVGIDYQDLPKDVQPDDMLLLDDGRIVLLVTQVTGSCIECTVKVGGLLSNNKGINRLGGGLSTDSLTDKDLLDMKVAAEMDVDYIALSFVKDANDVKRARLLLNDLNCNAGIVAKIERTEAVEKIDEIIEAADAVMVARGDLGVELGYAELPGVQKRIIQRARALNKVVITATQMMESMIRDPLPTRAEVSDVANAVLDGTDAVMLSAETATGAHPILVIDAMANICLGAEKDPSTQLSHHRVTSQFTQVDEAIAMATMYTANHFDIKGIIALTESGSTPLWMSRIRSGIPIYGLSRHVSTQRKMTLYRAVYPIQFDATCFELHLVNEHAIKALVELNLVQTGDRVIITKGSLVGIHGKTNSLRIITVS